MRYCALLRGINVGGNHKVDMRRLKSLVEGMGCTQVSTYINSGNLFFSSPLSAKTLRAALEKRLRDELGFNVPTLVISQRDMRRIAAAIPKDWLNDVSHRTDVAYLFPQADEPKILDRLPFNRALVEARYVKGAIFWRIRRKDVMKSRLGKIIGHPVYKSLTIRNVNTARHLGGQTSDSPPAEAIPSSIDTHIRKLETKQRTIAEKLRQTIKSLAPDAVETISYGIPTFDLNGKHLVHFAGFKTHLGFFPTSSPIRAFAKDLAPYPTSKGTIRFAWDKPIPWTLIKKIVKFRVAEVTSLKRKRGKK